MKFSLLKEEDIYGENRLSIFKKISPIAMATDVVKLNDKKDAYSYWLDSYRVRHVHNGPTWRMNTIPKTIAEYYNSVGHTNLTDLNDEHIGVRLKVSINDIKDEIIKDIEERFYGAEEECGVKVVLALEWPQSFATGEDKEKLDLLEQCGKLKSAKRVFSVLHNKEVEAVFYNQYRYVKIKDEWARVEPIQWYYAEEEQTLVTKKILFCCPMLEESGLGIENFSYEKSIIAKFIEEKFSKQVIMDPIEKELYDFPFAIIAEGYREELEEIIFWKNFLEKREKRKENLERVKTMTVREFSCELPKIIDEILALNEEDEQYLKQHVIPYYCQKIKI